MFRNQYLLLGLGQPHAQPPTWKARVFVFVWFIAFDLSGMGPLPLAQLLGLRDS